MCTEFSKKIFYWVGNARLWNSSSSCTLGLIDDAPLLFKLSKSCIELSWWCQVFLKRIGSLVFTFFVPLTSLCSASAPMRKKLLIFLTTWFVVSGKSFLLLALSLALSLSSSTTEIACWPYFIGTDFTAIVWSSIHQIAVFELMKALEMK